MKVDISIIIVNYNSAEDISVCIDSIYKYTKDVNYEIIIVDNNSPERNIEFLDKKYPDIKLFFLKDNKGFGAGCNFGASKSSGKYLLFLNPDTIFNSNTIKSLYDFLLINKNASVCSPSFELSDGTQGYVYNKFPDLIWEFYDFFGRGYGFRLKKINKILNEAKAAKKAIIVDWNTAACLCIRKDIFDKIGGFDEEYFLYYEDVDLQKRIDKTGGLIYCLPYTSVIHKTNASTKKDKNDTVYFYNMYKSKLIYHSKNSNKLKYFFIKWLHITGILARLSALYFRNRYKEQRISKRELYFNILNIYFKYGRK